jgi:hypothetical protein
MRDFFFFTSEADGCFANFLALKIVSIERADLTGEILVEPVENNEEMRNPLTARASCLGRCDSESDHKSLFGNDAQAGMMRCFRTFQG